MSTPERAIVDTMFAAFAEKNVEKSLSTITKDTLWIHHGTQRLPSMRFVAENGVRQFFEINFSTMNFEYFRPTKIIQDGNIVVVFGEEKFTMPNQAGDLTQKWVQVYTIENGLIARMEEFATSADENSYGVVA